MGDKSKIEWTDATWNTVYGCTRASKGCDNCYAVKVTQRLAGTLDAAKGLVNPGKRHFNGTVRCLPDRLDQPLRWKRPRRIFVNSLSDLFHPDVPFDFIDKVFAVMALCPQHTFQVLTKRPERMWKYLTDEDVKVGICEEAEKMPAWKDRTSLPVGNVTLPLRNVWLGCSVENRATADERIPHLLQTPAAVRWLSMEPLLGPVELERGRFWLTEPGPRINWVVSCGESGPNARPMHPDWVRSIRDQCQSAGVPFLFKQHGEWVSAAERPWGTKARHIVFMWPDGRTTSDPPEDDDKVCTMKRVGKKAAGRELDGKVWEEYPTTEPDTKGALVDTKQPELAQHRARPHVPQGSTTGGES